MGRSGMGMTRSSGSFPRSLTSSEKLHAGSSKVTRCTRSRPTNECGGAYPWELEVGREAGSAGRRARRASSCHRGHRSRAQQQFPHPWRSRAPLAEGWRKPRSVLCSLGPRPTLGRTCHVSRSRSGRLDHCPDAVCGRRAGGPSYWRAANVRAMVRRGSLCGWREFSPGQRGGYGELISPGNWDSRFCPRRRRGHPAGYSGAGQGVAVSRSICSRPFSSAASAAQAWPGHRPRTACRFPMPAQAAGPTAHLRWADHRRASD